MATTEMNCLASGGDATSVIEDVIGNMATVTDSFPAIIGKHYLVMYSRGGSGQYPLNVASGGTVICDSKNNDLRIVSNNPYAMFLVQATATTISMEGSSNQVSYYQID